ncbi:type II toxin-antitoxin system PemK/MazF family toxin [Paucilactobacillus sp. N302-9]
MIVPKTGDIIWIDTEPHAGHEEGGHSPETGNIRRPMIVLSNAQYNTATGFVMGMLITSTHHTNHSFYLPFADFDSGINGDIVTFYMPTYDYHARHGEIIGHVADNAIIKELHKRISQILAN